MRRQRPALWLGLALLLPVLPTARAETPPAQDAGTAPAPTAPPAPPQESDADFKEKDAVHGTNVTASFRDRYQQDRQAQLSQQRRARFAGYRVILVPGFITKFYLQLSHIAKDRFKQEQFLDYLLDAKQELKDLGLGDADELLDKTKFNTQASVLANGERIARAVRDSAAAGKQVILISHSKGGNDALAALLLLQKNGGLKDVAGWIAIQSSFYGSPIADEVLASATLRELAKVFLEKSAGSLDALTDGGTAACERYMREHGKQVRELVKRVPILSFASWKPKPRDAQLLHPDTILFETRDQMLEKGMQNDGLVPTRSAVLPGTDYIAAAGIDHAETAMREPAPVQPSQLDRKRFLRALLSMLMDRIERKPAHAPVGNNPHRR